MEINQTVVDNVMYMITQLEGDAIGPGEALELASRFLTFVSDSYKQADNKPIGNIWLDQ